MIIIRRGPTKAKILKSCTSKKKYPKEVEARLAVQRVQTGTKLVMRVYECQYCDGWHLTSKWRTS